ncbi:UTP--glucose-1-phosphate uridylyltransferase [uncultured Actinomyces sp.]|uniref:UTP--glucose-1-phosphate uridylyltransferase n=1 Tax=uncultured Actinomyces sp. TaxID=249061 RepID=UPI002622C2A1|nr:UTP--glucose-1-phosphate uridylyltransferase [uncultured Actinomyces sp.]
MSSSLKGASVRHGVIPAAGRGTRFLPMTKAVPKEMLPIVDRPAIELVVEEATQAGLDDLLLISAAQKQMIEDHFDAVPDLEAALREGQKWDLLASVERYLDFARIHSVRQGHPRGLGHAVFQARHHVGGAPFAVLLPDDLMHPEDPVLEKMIAVREQIGGSVVALLEVTPQQATAYGSADVTAIPLASNGLDGIEGLNEGDVFRLNKIVEKPPIDEVLSEYASVGRYVLDPKVFEILETLPPGRGGEIQLTDSFQTLIETPEDQGGGVTGVVIRGRRFDTGDKLGYLQAVVEMGIEDPVLGDEFRALLKGLNL